MELARVSRRVPQGLKPLFLIRRLAQVKPCPDVHQSKIPTLRRGREGWGTRNAPVSARFPDFDAAAELPRRGMPRAVKTCSTMRAIVWRSGTGASAAAAATIGERVDFKAIASAAQAPAEMLLALSVQQSHRATPTLRRRREGWGTRKLKNQDPLKTNIARNQRLRRRISAPVQTMLPGAGRLGWCGARRGGIPRRRALRSSDAAGRCCRR